MTHWCKVLASAIHDVDYEALIEDQEAVSLDLIAPCGLAWNDRCRGFHAADRALRTASHWHVRQPIHRSSVGRRRNYSRHLGT